VLVFLAGAALIYFAWDAFAVLLVGVVISMGIDPFVTYLAEKAKIGRIFAAILVILAIIFIFAFGIYLITPVIFEELVGFLSHFTQSVSSIFPLDNFGFDPENLNLGLDKILSFVSGAGSSVPGAISSLFGNALLFFSAIFITLYLSIEKDGAENMLRAVMPDDYERPILSIFNGFKVKMRRWLGTQFVLSLFVGLAVGLGMWAIGVRYALVLGIIAAIFEVVPIIGPIMVGILAFIIAISDSTVLGIYALIFFFLVQQFENHILIPVIMGKSMRVHPVIVLVSLLAGGEIAGFIGIILSVPLAVLVQEVLNYLAERKERRPVLDM
jgi:predicted PurR-regulated permease PerM